MKGTRPIDEPVALVLTHESDPARTDPSMSLIALFLARSLGRRGVPVVRIHPNRLDRSLLSRYCTRVEVCPDFYQSEDDLLGFLENLRHAYRGRRLLIPASDDCAAFISKHHTRLSTNFDVLAPTWGVMSQLIDKQAQYRRAARFGVPVPETYFPTGLTDLRSIATRLRNYPYVIKPLVAHQWRRASMKGTSRGKKGFAVHSTRELLHRYEAIAAGDPRVMIQEVIGGADERLFTFLGAFDAHGRPLGYCIRRKVRQLPTDFGYCTLTVSCHDETVRAQSLRLMRGLGYQGLCGIEWKHDPKSGLYKLIEINPRAVNTSALAPACGVDLAWLAWRDRMTGDARRMTQWQDGVRWINAEQDFWAARELHRAGRLSGAEWRDSLRGPIVDASFAWDDLRPFAAQTSATLMRLATRLLRRRRAPDGPMRATA